MDIFKSKGTEYMHEFVSVLYEALQNTAVNSDEKVRFTLERILNIWKDRKLFTDDVIEKYRHILHNPNKKVEISTDDNILRSPVAQSVAAETSAVASSDTTSPVDNFRKRKLFSQLKVR